MSTLPDNQLEAGAMMEWELLATTYIDQHVHRMTRETLEGMARQINSSAFRRMVEHDMTLAPIGKSAAAVVRELDDGEFGLFVSHSDYEAARMIQIEGENFVELVVPGDDRPITSNWHKESDRISVSVDPVGVGDLDSLRMWEESLKQYGDVDAGSHRRESINPDPEIILHLGNLLWLSSPNSIADYFQVRTGEKAGDSSADNIGEVLGNRIYKLYEFLFEIPAEFARWVIGPTRSTTSIGVVSGCPDIILVVRSSDPEILERAADLERIADCMARGLVLRETHHAAEVHFFFSAEFQWILNYFITDTGSTIGRRESVTKRNRVRALLTRLDENEVNTDS